MKQIKYLIIVLLTLIPHFLNGFDITPININLKDIVYKDNKVIIYGDKGSFLISQDYGKTWEQRKAFENGNIINVFLSSDDIIAINDFGEVNKTENNGVSWSNIARLNDSIVYVINYQDNYYLQSRTKIYKADNGFRISAEHPNQFSGTWNYNGNYSMLFRKSMTSFKDKLIVQNDSVCLLIFDKDLIPLDTVSLKALGLSSSWLSDKYFAETDEDYFYLYISDGSNYGSIYRTRDFTKFEIFMPFSDAYELFKDSSYIGYIDAFNICNNKKYAFSNKKNSSFGPKISLFEILSSDSSQKIVTFDLSGFTRTDPTFLNFSNFFVTDNRFFILGDNKYIASIDLKNQNDYECTNFAGNNVSSDFLPDNINDSTLLFYNGKALYFTGNNCVNFKRERGDSIFFSKTESLSPKYTLYFKYFDDEENSLLYICNDSYLTHVIAFMTKDLGKTWEFDTLKSVMFNGNFSLSNLCYKSDVYTFVVNSKGNNIYNQIFRFNSNFELMNVKLDSLYFINLINTEDTNTYIALSTFGAENQIKFTSDGGSNWEIIKKYSITKDTNGFTIKELKSYTELEYKGTTYWILKSVSFKDSINRIEAFDVGTHKFYTLYEEKTNTEFGVLYAISAYKDNLFLAVSDTLFYSNDPFGDNNWKKMILPNKGRIWNNKLKIIKDGFIAFYEDDKHTKDLYLLKFNNQDPESIEEITLISDYFYSYPPYPMPAKDKVSSLIYWDSSSDIGTDEISVFDVEGNKAEGKENITIDRVNSYSGYLRWDCSGVPNGIYLIKIKHGTTTKSIKVIVER